ncbi:MAG: signal recognition particle-docking protein FtsY [Verrucomicrobiaceae bacterium]|nr:MAG: signal recognition particle-docking protein FtsY [Verrucomicrobiaceae bacterium]
MAGFFKKLIQRFTRRKVDLDELEETLITGDVGVPMTLQILEKLREMGRSLEAEEVVDVCRQEILKILPSQTEPLPVPAAGKPCVILVVGVNGTGKTTSTAKLAHWLRGQGKTVMLAAADTFRAAAIEQLDHWAQRLQIPITKAQYKADPAAVCHDAWEAASKRGIDYLICDTAGRLHNKHNLMEELSKIERVLGRKDPTAPHETLLVVDATTGSNALVQAREFQKAVGKLTGVIVTKLDGSGKGGVIVSIQQELKIPARFIGTGEGPDDFGPFESKAFVEAVL